MLKQTSKIGDIFCSVINSEYKTYFQIIAYDSTELNSDVIRIFKTKYQLSDNPNIDVIIADKVSYYVHCIARLGIVKKCWIKIGNSVNVGSLDNIVFKCRLLDNDHLVYIRSKYNRKAGFWYIWHINDVQFTYLNEGEENNYKNAYCGDVVTLGDVLDLLSGKKLHF